MFSNSRMSKKKELPLSGAEKVFTRDNWTKHVKSNNCYAYSVNDLRRFRPQKSVPGDRTNREPVYGFQYLTCGNLAELVEADNPGKVYRAKATAPCKQGFYKIMMFVAPSADPNNAHGGDFHFYKQHGRAQYVVRATDNYSSIARFFGVSPTTIKKYSKAKLTPGKKITFPVNLWSHKRGWATGPLLVDASGKTIKDPRKADKNYSSLKYNSYCSSFCVSSSGKAKTGKNA